MLVQGKDVHAFKIADVQSAPLNGENLMLCFPSSVAPKTSLLQHYITDAEMAVVAREWRTTIPGGAMISRHEDVIRSFYADSLSVQKMMPWKEEDTYGVYWTGKFERVPTHGDSGALAFSNAGQLGIKIIGAYNGSSMIRSFISAVTREMLEETAQTNGWPLKDVVIPKDLGITHTQDVSLRGTQMVPLGVVKHGGCVPKTNKTSWSALAKALINRGIQPMKIPTKFRKFLPEREYKRMEDAGVKFNFPCPADGEVNPWEYVERKLQILPVYVDVTRLEKTWSKADYPDLRGKYVVYSQKEVLFGQPGTALDRSHFAASPGYDFTVTPGCVTKNQIFAVNPEKMKSEESEWHPKYKAKVQEIHDTLRNGDIIYGVYTDTLKGEQLAAQSVLEKGKVRQFCAGNVATNTTLAQYFTYLSQAQKAQGTDGYCAVGLDVHSTEWASLVRKHGKFSNHICIDVGGWDLHMLYALHESEARFTSQLIAECDIEWPDELAWARLLPKKDQATLLYHAQHAQFMAIHIDGSNVYVTVDRMPSGTHRTSEGNSGLNLRIFKTTLNEFIMENEELRREGDLEHFMRNHLVAHFYGDDSWISVSNFLGKFVTKKTYAQKLKKLFNLDATDAGKNDIATDFDSFEEAIFLQRSPRYIEGTWRAPKPIEQIWSPLFWCDRKGSAIANATDTARSALIEAAHHGRAVFMRVRGTLEDVCRESNVPFDSFDYDVWCARYGK